MKTNFMKSTGMLIANMTMVSGIAVAQVTGTAGATGSMSGDAMSPNMGSPNSSSSASSAPMAGQGNNANPAMSSNGSDAEAGDRSAPNNELNSDLAADRPDRVKLDSDEAAGDDAPVRSETEVSNLDSVEQLDDYARSQAPDNNDGGDSNNGSNELQATADTAAESAQQRMNAAQGGAASNSPDRNDNDGRSFDQSEQVTTAAGEASATLQGQADANRPDNNSGDNSSQAPDAPDANSAPLPSAERAMSVAESQARDNAPDDNGNSDGTDLQSELSAAANGASQTDAPESNSGDNAESDTAEAQADRVAAQLEANTPDQSAPDQDGNAGGQESASVSTRDLPNDNRAPETPEANQTVTVRGNADQEEEERPSELSADSRDVKQPVAEGSPRELPETPRAQTRLSERAESADEDPVAEEE